jgi:hypothetical protein
VIATTQRAQTGNQDVQTESRAEKLADEVADGLKSKLREVHRHRKVNISDVRPSRYDTKLPERHHDRYHTPQVRTDSPVLHLRYIWHISLALNGFGV